MCLEYTYAYLLQFKISSKLYHKYRQLLQETQIKYITLVITKYTRMYIYTHKPLKTQMPINRNVREEDHQVLLTMISIIYVCFTTTIIYVEGTIPFVW